MGIEQRKHNRVVFARGVAARIMAIDGTWCHDVMMEDVSTKGAKLTLERPLDRTIDKEFFLALSTTGKVFRRCELTWVNGNQKRVGLLKYAELSQFSGCPAPDLI